MCSPTPKLSEPHCLEVEWTFDYIGIIKSLAIDDWTQPAAPLPFLEAEEWGWNFQASNQALVFLETGPHPEAIREPIKNYLLKIKDTPVPSSLRKLQGFLKLWARKHGQRANSFLW